MRFFCIGFRCGNDVAACINFYLRGCIIHFRKYGLPYGLSDSLYTLHLMVTHFDATLGMGGWLDLTQQGLSPCKRYRASWCSENFCSFKTLYYFSFDIECLFTHYFSYYFRSKCLSIRLKYLL